MRRVRAVAVSAAACLLLAACGQADEPTTPILRTPVSPAPSVVQVPTEPVPTKPLPTKPVPTEPLPTEPLPTGAPAAPMTLSGTVEAGVEANCLLLRGYLLLGGDRTALRAGATVTVTGRVARDLLTTCQQGTPFTVETVQVN
jgi:hypothetical protein